VSALTLVAVAVVTVGSRVAALALLPPPRGAVAGLVRRLPAPLFAALAALSLTGSDAGIADPPMLAAVGCALLVTRWSSLLLTLVAGLAGFLVATLIW
jgi:branched-subunit amino acid transport protein